MREEREDPLWRWSSIQPSLVRRCSSAYGQRRSVKWCRGGGGAVGGDGTGDCGEESTGAAVVLRAAPAL